MAAAAAAAAPSAGATGVTVLAGVALAVPLLSAVLLLLLRSAPGGLLLLCPACPITSVPARCPASSAEWEQLLCDDDALLTLLIPQRCVRAAFPRE